MSNISLSNLSSEIVRGFQTYTENVTSEINEEVKARSKELVKAIKASSPLKTGDYKKGWTSKIENSHGRITVTVYNKKKGSLVHLLENGHAKRGGGRVSGKPHVRPATDRETALLEENIKSIIKRGG